MFDSEVNPWFRARREAPAASAQRPKPQRALYADLVVDGDLGPRTLVALRAYLKKDKAELLLKMLNVLQGMHYIQFMTQSPIQEAFARGWFKRVEIDVA